MVRRPLTVPPLFSSLFFIFYFFFTLLTRYLSWLLIGLQEAPTGRRDQSLSQPEGLGKLPSGGEISVNCPSPDPLKGQGAIPPSRMEGPIPQHARTG